MTNPILRSLGARSGLILNPKPFKPCRYFLFFYFLFFCDTHDFKKSFCILVILLFFSVPKNNLPFIIMSRFRLRAKNIFLTWPQCTSLLNEFESVEHFADYIQEKFRDFGFTEGMVAIEHHEDGNKHAHAVLCRQHTEAINNERFFDLGEFHPNIQKVRDVSRSIKYIQKEDNWFGWGNIEKRIRLTMNDHLLEVVRGKRKLEDIIDLHPILLRGYSRLKADLSCYSEDVSISHLQESPSILGVPLNGSVTWRLRTTFKTPSLYIWGPPSTGKTSIFLPLGPRVYWAPSNNDWNGLRPDFHHLILFDEFRGQHLPLSVLLQLMAGNPVHLNTKGGTIYLRHKIPVCFTSNLDPRQVFKERNEAFLIRIFELYCTDFQKYSSPHWN